MFGTYSCAGFGKKINVGQKKKIKTKPCTETQGTGELNKHRKDQF